MNIPAQLLEKAKETGIMPKQVATSGGAPHVFDLLRAQRRKLFDGVRLCFFVLNERYLRIHDPDRPNLKWDVRLVPRLLR